MKRVGSFFAVTLLVAMAVAAAVYVYFTKGKNPDTALTAGAITVIALGGLSVARSPLRQVGGIGLMMLLLICVYGISFLANREVSELASSARAVAFIGLVFGCFFVGYGSADQKSLKLLEMVAWGGSALLIGVSALVSAKAGHLPKNVLGGLSMHLIMLATALRAKRTGRLPTALLACALVVDGFITGQRLVQVLAILIPVTAWTASKDRSRLSSFATVALAVAMAFGSVVFMLTYRSLSGFTTLNAAVQGATGRQITSGRELLWGSIVRGIEQAPWIGHGPSTLATTFTGSDLSAHSAFLHIGLQTGIIGLLATAGVLASIMVVGLRSADRQLGSLLVVYVAVVIAHNTFETALYQNSFAIASITWLALGVMCRLSGSGPSAASVSSAGNSSPYRHAGHQLATIGSRHRATA